MKKKYLLLALAYTSNSFASGLQCRSLFDQKPNEVSASERSELKPVSFDLQTKQIRHEAVLAGKRVSAFFKAAGDQILERGNVLDSLLISMIAKEHLLMVGPPGNAKTTLTKLIFENIKERQTGNQSFFATQMTAETSLSDTHGGINYKTLQETGRQERLYEEGILGAKVAMLDEQFDMRPNGYRNILDVLAERAHAQSGKKFKGKTWTVVGASNTFIPEVYAKFDGSDQPRALIDRYSYVLFIPAEMQKASSNRTIVQGAQKERKALPEVYFEDFEAVQKLVPEVTIPDYVSDMLSLFQYRLRTIFEAKEEASLQEYKEKIQNGEKPLPPYKSTKYMSGRTLGKAAGILRAIVALDYASHNGQRKLSVTTKDLNSIVNFYSLGGPDEAFIQNQLSRASKEVEKEQLKTILWERKVVRETLEAVLKEFNAKVTQMGSQDLYMKVKNYKDLSAGERRELIDTLRALYMRKAEIANYDQAQITPDIIAEVSIAELVPSWLKVIEPNAAENILAAWEKNTPITKNRNADGRYATVSETPSGSWSLMDIVPEKLKQAARDLIAAKEATDLKAQQDLEKVRQDADTAQRTADKRNENFNEDASKELAAMTIYDYTVVNFKAVLDEGANPDTSANYGGGEGLTTLNAAVLAVKPEIVKLFLEYGADPNVVSQGRNAFQCQQIRPDAEILKLLQAHAFLNKKVKKFDAEATAKLASLDVWQVSVDSIKEVLEQGADPNVFATGEYSSKDWTQLNAAIVNKKFNVAKLLLEFGANPNISSLGKTSRQWLLENPNAEILELVQQYESLKGFTSMTPESKALTAFNEEATKKLASLQVHQIQEFKEALAGGADPNVIGKVYNSNENWTQLNALIARTNPNVELIKLILSYGARTDMVSAGKTGLQWAEQFGNKEVIELMNQYRKSPEAAGNMTEQVPEKSNATQYDSQASEELASIQDVRVHKTEYFENLLKRGADPDTLARDLGKGWTVLSLAVQAGRADVVKLFLDHQARTDIVSDFGTPQELAARYAQHEIAEMLKNHEALKAKSVAGTPKAYNKEATEKLASYAKESMTASLLKQLLDQGADPDTLPKGHNGNWTYLNVAAWVGRADWAELLLDRGANPNLQTTIGSTLQIAQQYNNHKVIELLKMHAQKETLPKIYNAEEGKKLASDFWGKWQFVKLEDLKRYIEDKNVDPNTIVSDASHEKWTLIGILSYFGRREMVKYLLEHGGNPLLKSRLNQRILTASEWAADQRHIETVQIINDYIAVHPELTEPGP